MSIENIQVEDQSVGLVQAGVEHQFGLVAGEVEPGAAEPVSSASVEAHGAHLG